MVFHPQQACKAIALAAFSLFFLELHTSGDILKYVNPAYTWLSLCAAYLFFFLGFVQFFRLWSPKNKGASVCCCDHHHSRRPYFSYSVLVFPLVTGFLLPPQTLGASIAAQKGAGLLLQSKAETLSGEHEEMAVDRKEIQQAAYDQKMNNLEGEHVIHLTDDVFEAYYGQINADPGKYAGRTIKMNGFIFKENSLQANQLVLSRFLITHCVADASLIGFLVEFDKASNFKQDTWLEIEGTISLTSYNGTQIPVLEVNSWKTIEEPEEPYVYPLYIKLA
ncbi:TIGR03943 family putative permease subunit [Domibacillus robiginosus]|uniref:TIGR03943 family putative permease subunit n=1 Tax=Domibacillus robiginosus TaxID=1071054 RepID=UPI00067DE213|nr:TIGR03943 family protein [Domibacillus robiginosus]